MNYESYREKDAWVRTCPPLVRLGVDHSDTDAIYPPDDPDTGPLYVRADARAELIALAMPLEMPEAVKDACVRLDARFDEIGYVGWGEVYAAIREALAAPAPEQE